LRIVKLQDLLSAITEPASCLICKPVHQNEERVQNKKSAIMFVADAKTAQCGKLCPHLDLGILYFCGDFKADDSKDF
jgi:hypothetical protein